MRKEPEKICGKGCRYGFSNLKFARLIFENGSTKQKKRHPELLGDKSIFSASTIQTCSNSYGSARNAS